MHHVSPPFPFYYLTNPFPFYFLTNERDEHSVCYETRCMGAAWERWRNVSARGGTILVGWKMWQLLIPLYPLEDVKFLLLNCKVLTLFLTPASPLVIFGIELIPM